MKQELDLQLRQTLLISCHGADNDRIVSDDDQSRGGDAKDNVISATLRTALSSLATLMPSVVYTRPEKEL